MHRGEPIMWNGLLWHVMKSADSTLCERSRETSKEDELSVNYHWRNLISDRVFSGFTSLNYYLIPVHRI